MGGGRYTPHVKILVVEDELDVGAVFRDFLLRKVADYDF